MPQFDFANVFIPQLFWLSVFFVILYFGIVKLTLPRLGKVMNERESKISDDLTEARAAKERADAIAEENRVELEEKRDAARMSIAAAKAEAGKAGEVRIKAAEDRISATLDEAEARIAQARDEALASLREAAVETAQAMVAKLTGKEPTSAEIEREVDTALAR